MKKNRFRNQQNKHDGIEAKFLEIKIEDVNGDSSRLIKRFIKKVRKEEILKPYYNRLMFFQTKNQKRRQKKMKAIHLHKKMQKIEQE